ncbi:Glu/Leu/Phe/Val family dehydrogenase [Miniphocaeibacter massiliensis]|uniref:Glu/Leu/Phe/Val family dehydrogenase n=1 Tax=Miniphocaeibacter massiliensis TaxID=2041841 RepID=UPI000C06BC9A|nr:Glu/Leu/Phe/Val dehydrogenase [Miniphocaeibacter massiliensis]
MSKENLNPLVSAQSQLKVACDKLGLDKAVYEILKEPERVIEVNIPVKMDDGSLRVFKGFRSTHSTAVGPGKGGVRFHPNVTADEVKALSMWMTFKCGVTGIPYGGGKGGIVVDPTELSKGELERLSRGYIRKIYKFLGEKVDIPAPDVNTNGQIMSWMLDEYVTITGEHANGVLTGKPIEFGGSKGRNEATGLGVAIIARETYKGMGYNIEDATVAVQGFGNVGSFSVKNIEKMGGKVVAIAEYSKAKGTYALYKETGFTFEELLESKNKNNGTLESIEGSKEISIEEFWALDVDILVPAALENAIKVKEANEIKAKLIVEGANGPVTLDADKLLTDRGVVVAPDILANSGGVTVSYFEWVQNLYGYYWNETDVEEKQEEAMVNAFNDTWTVKEEYNVPLREATYMHSLKRVSEVIKLRGWY